MDGSESIELGAEFTSRTGLGEGGTGQFAAPPVSPILTLVWHKRNNVRTAGNTKSKADVQQERFGTGMK
jgi:hypothetical protein